MLCGKCNRHKVKERWKDLIGVICDTKVSMKMKALVYQTLVLSTLMYGCETWTMSVKDEKRMSMFNRDLVRWAVGVNLLEHRRNEAILEEAKTDPIATVMRRRRLEWFGHMKRRQRTENITTVAMMKMVGKCPKGALKRFFFLQKSEITMEVGGWVQG